MVLWDISAIIEELLWALTRNLVVVGRGRGLALLLKQVLPQLTLFLPVEFLKQCTQFVFWH